MALILRIPDTSFTDTTIPVLRNDLIANSGTLDIFDARDADVSWPSQSDPVEGTDTWKSLLSVNTASFAGTTGWTNGFTIDATADVITMPSTFKLPGSGDGVVVFWVKFGTQGFTSGSNNYIARVGAIGGASQWIAYMQYGTTDANTYFGVYSGNNANFALDLAAINTLPASKVAQIAVAMELVGGVYVYKGFVNGELKKTFTSALATLPQPASQMLFGGSTNAVNQTVLRAVVDDLSATTPEAFVALDYTTHVARLSA